MQPNKEIVHRSAQQYADQTGTVQWLFYATFAGISGWCYTAKPGENIDLSKAVKITPSRTDT